ncbi:cleavage and polyadenylation specificity factor subunit 2 isoform X2 [Molossus molossus]|uniref:cleavage and polyadenylation specificity factor subunit 2 isoform X2 n=1 Tax=Molossus molossus TaxID=27622 RepID=UPI001746695E|nr:cleavage and polyadenylation specificity factor subunit 2 isoform X2 [Molossus molossus]
MTSIIKLTTLSGVQEESALCYLLQVDEYRFLLDCGWDEHFSMDIIDSLRKHVHQIDAVLLSHPDPLHLGALPYAVGKLGLNCAIYATIPVYKMGQMFMYDLYQSRHNTEDFTLFTLDDVDAAFDKIQQLKFSQIVNLKGKGHGLSITPLPAGHMIGGTIWKIVKDGEEEIVYAVDFNHKREIHLNGCSLEMLSRPSLLITDSFNATYVQPRRKQRDEQLLTNVLETLREIELRKRVKLEGKELEEYLEKEKLKKEAAKKLEQSKEADIDSSDESDVEEDIDQPSAHKTKHDLMMKGEGSRKGSFFKQAKKSYPMFPAPEERIKWDEYGEIIKPEDFLVPELQATEEEKSKLESGLTNGDEPMDQDLSDVPTKCISMTESIEIKARVTYIDYEGRSDGDSIKKIINQMKPRQLIIVHGPPEASQDLAECCRAFGGKDIKVYMPKLHETVDATSETHIYQVRLKDSLVSSLQFCKAKDAELAWIDGVLDMRVSKVDTGVILEEGELKDDVEDSEMQVDAPSDSSVIAQQKAMKSLFGDDEKEIGEESEIIPTLEPLPPNEVPGHQSVFMNEPRLSDFKQVLLREGIQAEFVGGVLVCNNQVAVRRTETGRIGLEGCLCQDFYRIRDLLYEQYAIV